jgi:Ca-activated chloride channel homolog
MSPKLLPVLLLAGWAALPSLPSLPWSPHLPAWAERWLYNPRERTTKAIDAYRKGEADDAADLADTAFRIAPEDPQAQFNDGTAHLAARHGRRALSQLEKSVRGADPELAPAAWYNLGNARLSAGDASGAVEAYKQALRRTPEDLNAKHNLELALREREKQKQRMRGPGEGSRGRRPQGQREPSGRGGNQGPPQKDPSRSNAPGQQDQPQGQGRPQGQGQQPQQPNGQGSALPRFQNQPDMTAQEAASLLQAVENLERQQRRQQAAQRARQKAVRGKDW